MKTIKYTGIILAATLLSIRVMGQQTEQLTVPLSDPGKPYKLTADLVFGSIKASSYDGKDVIIELIGDVKKKDSDEEHKVGMRRISGGGGLDIIAKERNNQVNISTEVPIRNVNLNIKLPRGINMLKLTTINGKGILVSNVSGDLEINNTNGSIILEDVSGSVVANTVNGNVRVTFKNIYSKAAMAFSTLNGNVDVTLPANLKANVKLKSDRGNIYSDFDVLSDKPTAKVTKNNGEGMYRLMVDETVNGKINGGGPELLMNTMNGNIYMRKVK